METEASRMIDEICGIYRLEVLSGKTRRVQLLGRKCTPLLMKTFLGYELKMGNRRVNCPDLVTAQYLQLFAEVGFRSIEIPYDPTRTAELLPHLLQSFARLKASASTADLLRRRYQGLRHRLLRQRV